VILALVLAALVPFPAAFCKPPSITVDAWVRDSALVVDGRALAMDGTKGRFEVLQVLKGEFKERELSAFPLETRSCVGPRDQTPFPAGPEVVLFLGQPERDAFPVAGQGVAWIQVTAQSRTEVLEAVGKVVEIEALPAPETRMKAYLDAVEGANRTLRGVALRVIASELHGKDKAAPWEDRLAAMIRSPVPDARLAAIQALRFFRSEKALPALLEAVGDENRSVRECASMALAPYDTEVTVRRLLEAARRPDMVPRVIVDLRPSRRPEAREALMGFLRSEDAETRKFAAGSFYEAVYKGDPVILELHRLVGDPDAEVRVAALAALHKSPLPETLGVLLGALRRKDLDPREQVFAVDSLSVVCGEIQFRKASLSVLREAADLPDLMAGALRAESRVAGSAVGILGFAGTPAARDLLRRVEAGEFGPGLVERARKTLECLGRQ